MKPLFQSVFPLNDFAEYCTAYDVHQRTLTEADSLCTGSEQVSKGTDKAGDSGSL